MPIGVPSRAYHSPESWPIVETKPIYRHKSRFSCTRFVERRLVSAWKRVTGVTRKPQRASILPADFIIVTSRRRSVMFA